MYDTHAKLTDTCTPEGEVRGEGGGGEGGREREGGGVYGIAIIIRNVIEHNREWTNKCVLDKPSLHVRKLNG